MIDPASFLGLLRHEVRLVWRSGSDIPWRALAFLLIALLVHIPATTWVIALRRSPLPDAEMVAWGAMVALGAWLWMLSQATEYLFTALYSRRDLEWLLTTPVRFLRVLRVRVLGATITVALTVLMVVGPFANVFALTGTPAMLLVYPVSIALAALAASLGTGLCIALVSWFGQQRTRALMTMISVLIGFIPLLAWQMQDIILPVLRTSVRAKIPGLSIVGSPARAALGGGAVAAAIMAAALIAIVAVPVGLECWFVAGVTARPVLAARLVVYAAPMRIRSPTRTLLISAIRRMRRSPALFGKAAAQLIYLVPIAGSIWRAPTGSLVAEATLTGMLVFAAGSVGHKLAGAIIAGDEAAEFVRTAPVSPSQSDNAGLVAASLGSMAMIGLPVGLMLVWFPAHAVLLLVGVIGSGCGSILVALWRSPRGKRNDLGSPVAQVGGVFAEFAINLLWTAATTLALYASWWSVASAALAVAGLGAVRATRVD